MTSGALGRCRAFVSPPHQMNSRLLFLLNHHHLHPHPQKLLHLRGLKAVISEMDYAPWSCVGFDGLRARRKVAGYYRETSLHFAFP